MREAEEVGALLADRGAIVVCGGLGGVMAAVARGVREHDGTTIALLPGDDPNDANDDITLALPTGIGELRNAVIAHCSQAMIAIGGGYGTLTEIAFAMRLGKPVVGVHTWDVRRADDDAPDAALNRVDTPREAVDWALARV